MGGLSHIAQLLARHRSDVSELTALLSVRQSRDARSYLLRQRAESLALLRNCAASLIARGCA